MERGLAQLVLTIVELLREIMEPQALRRIDGGTLSEEQVERLGQTFMESTAQKATEEFGLTKEDLNLDLGPLGRSALTDAVLPRGHYGPGLRALLRALAEATLVGGADEHGGGDDPHDRAEEVELGDASGTDGARDDPAHECSAIPRRMVSPPGSSGVPEYQACENANDDSDGYQTEKSAC